MLKKRNFIYLAPDDGGNGGNPNPVEPTKPEVDSTQAPTEKSEADKALEEVMKVKEATLAEFKTANLMKHGIDEKYAPLIQGTTVEEIKASGELLSELIAAIKTEAETNAKKMIANTGAPGNGTSSTEMDSVAYYEALIGGAK